jgi:hypothetical protein
MAVPDTCENMEKDFLSNTCCMNFIFKKHENPPMEAKK